METATIRIPAEKKNLLKTIASLENKKMNDIVVKLIDDYAERRQGNARASGYSRILERNRRASNGKFVKARASLLMMSEKSWSVKFAGAREKDSNASIISSSFVY